MTLSVTKKWATGFLIQAMSDKQVYDFLVKKSFPVCHSLHFLQMYLEKLAKAHLHFMATKDSEVAQVRRSHKVIARVLPAIYRTQRIREKRASYRAIN